MVQRSSHINNSADFSFLLHCVKLFCKVSFEFIRSMFFHILNQLLCKRPIYFHILILWDLKSPNLVNLYFFCDWSRECLPSFIQPSALKLQPKLNSDYGGKIPQNWEKMFLIRHVVMQYYEQKKIASFHWKANWVTFVLVILFENYSVSCHKPGKILDL